MYTSLPDELWCPGCFKPLKAEVASCFACGTATWVDGRLALMGPIEEGRPGMFRGLLRGDTDALEAVAVKVLDVGGLPNWRDYDRFRRQNEILSSLSHPRIPRARGEFEVGTRVLQCQTLVLGRSLARQLRGARLTPPEATRLAIDLLEILEYLHGRDVVHRDVKPDNVVIAGDRCAHLVDFGAARRLHEAPGKIDPEPTVVGTPGYMAPEQTRGEAVAQSDLYALGRLLQEALAGATPEKPLAALLPLLTKEDWRKRPASAADALAMLRPRAPKSRFGWWALAAAASAVAAIVGIVRVQQAKHKPAATPAAPAEEAVAAAPAADAATPSLEDQARALLYEWSLAQTERDMQRYGRCYAPDFKGVRRTPSGKVFTLDRAKWLEDRARIYSEPVKVETAEVVVVTDEAAGTATIRALQRFRRGTYAEHGHKQFVARRAGGAMQFTSEEMLDSKRGWDDSDYAALVPQKAADCKIAFDPSGHKYLVSIASTGDYAEALRAAARSRRAKRPAEIVWGPALTGLGPGFWVLAGAMDDQDKAAALAARVDGEVHEVSPAAPPGVGVVRLLARREVPTIFDAGGVEVRRMIAIVGAVAHVVAYQDVETYDLTDPALPQISTLSLADAKLTRPVRIVEHDGAPHLLDNQGHWHRVAEAFPRVPSFDPDENDGKLAKFADVTFELEGDGIAIRATGEEPDHWQLEPKSGMVRNRGVYRVGNDRLLVLRERDLYLFAVGKPEPRLTKLCVEVDGEGTEPGRGPAGITFGSMRLVTDRSGRLDVWTDQWGFVQPDIENVSGAKPMIECGENEYQTQEIGMVPLFHQLSVTATGSASCMPDCGD